MLVISALGIPLIDNSHASIYQVQQSSLDHYTATAESWNSNVCNQFREIRLGQLRAAVPIQF